MENNKEYDDLEILTCIRDRLFKAFKDNEEQLKVGDLLKVIELKKKLSVGGKAEKKFWDMVNKIREEELSPKASGKRPANRRSGKTSGKES